MDYLFFIRIVLMNSQSEISSEEIFFTMVISLLFVSVFPNASPTLLLLKNSATEMMSSKYTSQAFSRVVNI